MTTMKTTALLRYKGVSFDEVNSDEQNLVSKEYVDKCFYPFGKARSIEATPNTQNSSEFLYVIVPAVTDSYWSIIDPTTSGTITIIPKVGTYEDYDMFTFELMVVKSQSNETEIAFADNDIDWIGTSPVFESGKIYFLAFRMIYVGGSWKIIGNIQGILSI